MTLPERSRSQASTAPARPVTATLPPTNAACPAGAAPDDDLDGPGTADVAALARKAVADGARPGRLVVNAQIKV